MRYLYLLIDISALLFPLLLSFDKRVNFVQYWKYLFPSIFIGMVFFIPWDVAFTKAGVWGFNPDYLIGVSIFGLPIEEWLFFIVIPYACVFTDDVVRAYLRFMPFPFMSKSFSVMVAILLLAVVLFNDGLYTTITFTALAVLLLIHRYILKSEWLGYFHLSYLIILIPFMLTNGVLTGSFIENEVVWYNNAYNLGDRFFTIPIEDLFYGMLLLLTVTTPYEYLKKHGFWFIKPLN